MVKQFIKRLISIIPKSPTFNKKEKQFNKKKKIVSQFHSFCLNISGLDTSKFTNSSGLFYMILNHTILFHLSIFISKLTTLSENFRKLIIFFGHVSNLLLLTTYEYIHISFDFVVYLYVIYNDSSNWNFFSSNYSTEFLE